MYTIKFMFEQPGLIPVTLNNIEPGYSLLEIALNNSIELHHDCGGICACSTCHIYVDKGAEFVADRSRREEDLVDRAANRRLVSRLACQCLLYEGRGEIEVTLPDQSKC
jgi:2Fe-2S ferredoxin